MMSRRTNDIIEEQFVASLNRNEEFTTNAVGLIRAGFQAMIVQAYEPRRAVESLFFAAQDLTAAAAEAKREGRSGHPWEMVTWDIARGFTRIDGSAPSGVYEPLANERCKDLNAALDTLSGVGGQSDGVRLIVVMLNLQPITDQSLQARQRLQNLVTERTLSNQVRKLPIFVVQTSSKLHAAIDHLFQPMTFPAPSDEELGHLVSSTHSSYKERYKKTPPLTDETQSTLVASLRGLNRMQAEDALALSVERHSGFPPEIVMTLRDQKATLLGASGMLKYVPERSIPRIEDMVGFDALIPVIQRRALAYTAGGKQLGLDTPRGFVMLGVPGTGKSQIAKLVARIFQDACGQAFPTYWVQVGSIFGQYVGQSEERLEMLLSVLSAHRGVVAIFEEFEKVLGQSEGGGHEVANRVRGRLLNWMQEERQDTFVVATMNSIRGVAPEFFRRFDETWFTDLPIPAMRRQIMEVHFRKRGVSPDQLGFEDSDWASIVTATHEFVGSELEDVVTTARLEAFADRKASVPNFEEVMNAAKYRGKSTMAKTQPDVIKEIREFCAVQGRAVTDVTESSAARNPRNRRREIV